MSTPGTKKNRKRKATTNLGRQLMQKERQRLAKEAAELGEQLANEAKAARETKFDRPVKRAPKQQISLNRSVVRRCAAVLASEQVVVPIRIEQAATIHQMSAWTDFDQISVRYAPQDDVRLLSATIRGLLYHEGGHCRWSVPFRDLATMAGVPAPANVLHTAWNCLEDQRMETAVVSDSPRKAAYFTPMVMETHCRTIDYMAANYPLLVWRRYLPSKLVAQARRMFVARHGANGERLARELDRVVTNYVMATDAVTMWTAVNEYHALLLQMRPLASDMADAGHERQSTRELPDDFEGLTIPVDPSMIPPEGCEGDEDIEPSKDMALTDPEDFEHFLDILWTLLNGGDVFEVRYVVHQQSDDEDEGGNSPGNLSDERSSGDEPHEADDGEGDEGGGEGDDESGEDVPVPGDRDSAPPVEDEVDKSDDTDDGKDAEGEHNDEKGSDSKHGGATGSHTDDGSDLDTPFTQEDLDEMLQEAEEERYNQRDLDGDVESFADASNDAASDLDVYVGGTSTNVEAIAEAETLAQGIEDSFHAHTMDRAPAWVESQRRGVLNVQRYVTRQPGDVEFFRQWTEDDQPGFDLAVSVLLDYSGSMFNQTERLVQAGYACKLACDKLDIPCTVVLWDTDARTLWDASEHADVMPTISAAGGTDPSVALADLDNQRRDKAQHLVLIMTDGSWQGEWAYGKRHLAYYKDAGRKMIGFGYGHHLASGLISKGCDEAFEISDLMDIPHRLEEALLEMV